MLLSTSRRQSIEVGAKETERPSQDARDLNSCVFPNSQSVEGKVNEASCSSLHHMRSVEEGATDCLTYLDVRVSTGASDLSKLEEGAPAKDTSAEKGWDEGANSRNDETNMLLVFLGLTIATVTSLLLYLVPQLEPSPGDKTVALLRVILYNMNKTAFGDDIPTLTDWERPPVGAFTAQKILFFCLCTLLSGGFYILVIKFLACEYGLGWRNSTLDKAARAVFFLMHPLLAFALSGTIVALKLAL